MRANVVSSAQHDTLKSYFLSKLRVCFTFDQLSIVTFIFYLKILDCILCYSYFRSVFVLFVLVLYFVLVCVP